MNNLDILIPDLPESMTNAIIIAWHKHPGDIVSKDEILVEIETNKVILEIPALIDGVLDVILEDVGSSVMSHQIIGRLRQQNDSDKDINLKSKKNILNKTQSQPLSQEQINNDMHDDHHLHSSNLDINCTDIENTNTDCNIMIDHINQNSIKMVTAKERRNLITTKQAETRSKKRVPMTNLRKHIAERLLKVKNSTAMLTTFNEVNMKTIINLRKQYGKEFENKHGIRLGFMSFYIRSVVEALRRYPEINASIDGDDIVYYNYFDISIAVSTARGLVTPVLRNADMMCISDLEKQIKDFLIKGNNGKLTIDDLTGGNFTITNSGIFGSLMSTPIINPPQSAILGIHAIQDRPVVIDGEIKISPMMYIALSYDHRLIDGRESISFLMTIKKLLENPICLLLDI